MPTSHAETPENETNSHTQNALSLDPWEAAYLRFETPEEEIQKFIRRLTRLGAPQWPRDAEIVELFCGRGNGLCALDRLEFKQIEGVDLSPRLIAQYRGPAICIVGDCRRLPFADPESADLQQCQRGLERSDQIQPRWERGTEHLRHWLAVLAADELRPNGSVRPGRPDRYVGRQHAHLRLEEADLHVLLENRRELGWNVPPPDGQVQ